MSDNFTENLIKGKIVETIFQQMFLETGKYNVHPFGYEYMLSQIAHKQHDWFVSKVIEDVRHMPDFVITPTEGDGVYLVEVKYERELLHDQIQKTADFLHNNWTCPWLFVATQENFYFSSCKDIVEQKHITPLDPENWVNRFLQDKYLTLLHQFLK